MEFNPIEKQTRNDRCVTCKENNFMINQFQDALQDLNSEMKMEFSHQKRNMESQKAEIIVLKKKCVHLEEEVAYIKSSNLSEEGENSVHQEKKQHSSEET